MVWDLVLRILGLEFCRLAIWFWDSVLGFGIWFLGFGILEIGF